MGRNQSPEENVFREARQRCENPRNKNYKDYGGRGIEMRFQSFTDLYSHIGPRPSAAHTVDRIDTNGHYEAGNIRWATRSEQAINRRAKTTCRRGHLFSEENTYTYTISGQAGTHRHCRTCDRIHQANYKARKLEAARKGEVRDEL